LRNEIGLFVCEREQMDRKGEQNIMPSTEHLQQKQAIVEEIKGKLDKATAAVIIDYIGLTVSEADAMRKKLRESDVDYKVYKNTLVRRAIEGTQYESLNEVLEGPSALAVSYADVTLPARILSTAMKDYKKMSFKAGVIEGNFYDANAMQTIASIPSREELIAKFLGSIKNPIGAFVRTLSAIADAKGDGTTAPAPAEEAAPAETAAPTEEAASADAPAPVEEAASAETAAPAEEAVPAAEEAPNTEESAEESAKE
jgi:large subunit ribosomal protein L10